MKPDVKALQLEHHWAPRRLWEVRVMFVVCTNNFGRTIDRILHVIYSLSLCRNNPGVIVITLIIVYVV